MLCAKFALMIFSLFLIYSGATTEGASFLASSHGVYVRGKILRELNFSAGVLGDGRGRHLILTLSDDSNATLSEGGGEGGEGEEGDGEGRVLLASGEWKFKKSPYCATDKYHDDLVVDFRPTAVDVGVGVGVGVGVAPVSYSFTGKVHGRLGGNNVTFSNGVIVSSASPSSYFRNKIVGTWKTRKNRDGP